MSRRDLRKQLEAIRKSGDLGLREREEQERRERVARELERIEQEQWNEILHDCSPEERRWIDAPVNNEERALGIKAVQLAMERRKEEEDALPEEEKQRRKREQDEALQWIEDEIERRRGARKWR
jgi:hypothetical protein